MDVHELKDRARALVVKGRLEKAEVLYRQVVTLVPGDAPAWIRHAETLKRLGRVPESVWSYRTAANILRALGHEARALACLKIALDLKPDDIDLITEIIRIEMHRKRRQERGPLLPSRDSTAAVPLADLGQPKLALPMLTEVDPRQSADSVAVRVVESSPTEPGLADPLAVAPAARSLDGSAPPFESSPTVLEAPAASGTTAAGDDGRSVASGPRTAADGASEEGALAEGVVSAPAERLEVQGRAMPAWPQVRRLHDREVAIKASPTSDWVVVSSESPLEVRFERTLSIDEHTPWLE